MRFRPVSDLIADPWRQAKNATVSELGFHFAGDAEQHVSLLAPVVGAKSGAVFDHSHAKIAERLRPPGRGAGLAFVMRRLDILPVGRVKRDR